VNIRGILSSYLIENFILIGERYIRVAAPPRTRTVSVSSTSGTLKSRFRILAGVVKVGSPLFPAYVFASVS
jgi:hypothetical protein